MQRLAGKSVIVTGGSRGIGAGICQRLAQEGARVAFSYSSSEAAARKVAESLPGEGHFCFQLNIADPAGIETAFAETIAQLEKVDGLVNNAGLTRDNLLLRMKLEELDDVINTNLRGSVWCTKVALKSMLKQRAGSIVNITSVIGQMGNAGQGNYAASKAGLEAFSKSIAKEVGSRGIRVNCIAPGFIETDMTNKLPEEQKTAILQSVPLARFGTVEDIAAAVAYLVSDDSGYMTGQTLSINGGMNM